MFITQADCIRTGRLELRSYESGDAKRIVELLTNPEVSKTFMVPGFQSEQQALDLAHNDRVQQNGGYSPFRIHKRASKAGWPPGRTECRPKKYYVNKSSCPPRP